MVDGQFTVLNNIATECETYGLYKFIEQPEFCTHATCRYEKGKPKPKCSYQSWRKATPRELSDSSVKNVYIQVCVTFIHDNEDHYFDSLFDFGNNKFITSETMDGGNGRLVTTPSWKGGFIEGLSNIEAVKAELRKQL